MFLEPDDFPEFQIIKDHLNEILLILTVLWLIFVGAVYFGIKWMIS